jgi:bifunctional DNA-binding transcriptional regulator/antitoxin component of YhaV-PrlF toxin-antitoxin module
MAKLTVTNIDGQPAIVLPTEIVNRLGLVEGSEIILDDDAVRYADPVLMRQVEIMREVMERRRDALRRLAES